MSIAIKSAPVKNRKTGILFAAAAATMLLVDALVISEATVQADIINGTVFLPGTQHQKSLFIFKRVETKEGSILTSKTTFTDSQGKVAAEEQAVAADEGQRITQYFMNRPQTGESGKLEVKDGKVRFSWTKLKDGKPETESDSEDAKPNMIIGPTTVPYLHAHWAEILKGDDVEVRYAALERKETVGFKFFKIGETQWDGHPAIQVKMKPSSFVIAALVKPLIFTFDKETRRLVELEGRTLPKIQVDGNWKDLDADIVYR